MRNVLSAAMRDWVLKGTSPPPSRYPTLARGSPADPTRAAMGVPRGVPGISERVFLPENFIFPVFDYDWGPGFDRVEASRRAGPDPAEDQTRAAGEGAARRCRWQRGRRRTDGAGDAPLGTYLGWNITGNGLHAGQVCNYAGGYVPFAHARGARGQGDPRLSLEERYRDHAGYVAAVKAAAEKASAEGFLLSADRDRLLKEASESEVLR